MLTPGDVAMTPERYYVIWEILEAVFRRLGWVIPCRVLEHIEENGKVLGCGDDELWQPYVARILKETNIKPLDLRCWGDWAFCKEEGSRMEGMEKKLHRQVVTLVPAKGADE